VPEIRIGEDPGDRLKKRLLRLGFSDIAEPPLPKRRGTLVLFTVHLGEVILHGWVRKELHLEHLLGGDKPTH
jgi:hypothetical protein